MMGSSHKITATEGAANNISICKLRFLRMHQELKISCKASKPANSIPQMTDLPRTCIQLIPNLPV
jgi:hypothetical protein